MSKYYNYKMEIVKNVVVDRVMTKVFVKPNDAIIGREEAYDYIQAFLNIVTSNSGLLKKFSCILNDGSEHLVDNKKLFALRTINNLDTVNFISVYGFVNDFQANMNLKMDLQSFDIEIMYDIIDKGALAEALLIALTDDVTSMTSTRLLLHNLSCYDSLQPMEQLAVYGSFLRLGLNDDVIDSLIDKPKYNMSLNFVD